MERRRWQCVGPTQASACRFLVKMLCLKARAAATQHLVGVEREAEWGETEWVGSSVRTHSVHSSLRNSNECAAVMSFTNGAQGCRLLCSPFRCVDPQLVARAQCALITISLTYCVVGVLRCQIAVRKFAGAPASAQQPGDGLCRTLHGEPQLPAAYSKVGMVEHFVASKLLMRHCLTSACLRCARAAACRDAKWPKHTMHQLHTLCGVGAGRSDTPRLQYEQQAATHPASSPQQPAATSKTGAANLASRGLLARRITCAKRSSCFFTRPAWIWAIPCRPFPGASRARKAASFITSVCRHDIVAG